MRKDMKILDMLKSLPDVGIGWYRSYRRPEPKKQQKPTWLCTEEIEYAADGVTVESKMSKRYYDNGKIKSEVGHRRCTVRKAYFYNEKGHLWIETDFFHTKVYSTDDDGKVTSVLNLTKAEAGQAWRIDTEAFNHKGMPLLDTQRNQDNGIWFIHKYKYYDDGVTLKKSDCYDTDTKSDRYKYSNVDDCLDHAHICEEKFYDSNGQIKKIISSYGNSKRIQNFKNMYDSDGRILCHLDEHQAGFEYKYDEDGNLSEKCEYKDGKELKTITRYKYSKFIGTDTINAASEKNGYDRIKSLSRKLTAKISGILEKERRMR